MFSLSLMQVTCSHAVHMVHCTQSTCSVFWLSSVFKQAAHTFTTTDSSDFLASTACDGDGLLRELSFSLWKKNVLGSPF